MGEVYEFPKGVKRPSEGEGPVWKIPCPNCDGTHWTNYGDQEEWTKILFSQCDHCDFIYYFGVDDE